MKKHPNAQDVSKIKRALAAGEGKVDTKQLSHQLRVSEAAIKKHVAGLLKKEAPAKKEAAK